MTVFRSKTVWSSPLLTFEKWPFDTSLRPEALSSERDNQRNFRDNVPWWKWQVILKTEGSRACVDSGCELSTFSYTWWVSETPREKTKNLIPGALQDSVPSQAPTVKVTLGKPFQIPRVLGQHFKLPTLFILWVFFPKGILKLSQGFRKVQRKIQIIRTYLYSQLLAFFSCLLYHFLPSSPLLPVLLGYFMLSPTSVPPLFWAIFKKLQMYP